MVCLFSKSDAEVYLDLDWYQYTIPALRNAIVAQLMSGMAEQNRDVDLLMQLYPDAKAAFPKRFIDSMASKAYDIADSDVVIIGIMKFTLIKDGDYVIDGFKRLLTYLFEKSIHFDVDFRSSDKPSLVSYDGTKVEYKLVSEEPDEFMEAAMYKPQEE